LRPSDFGFYFFLVEVCIFYSFKTFDYIHTTFAHGFVVDSAVSRRRAPRIGEALRVAPDVNVSVGNGARGGFAIKIARRSNSGAD
jgi:hypothetical protein